MSVAYRTALTGPFPRPEDLVQTTRDLDRGRTTPAAAEAVFQSAERRVLALETELGLDGVTGGYLRWPDLFRPFTAAWDGVSAGTLTRFFETNTFYRQPVFEAAPRPGKSSLASWLPHGPKSRLVLPGPYTFAYLSDIRYGGGDPSAAMGDIAGALAAELGRFGHSRPAQVQFQEPLLGYAPFGGDVHRLVEAYRPLAEAARGTETSVWTFFGDAGRNLGTLAQLPVDTVGLDLFESVVPSGADLRGKGLGLGVIESRTTIPEDLGEVAGLVRGLVEHLQPPTVWLGPSPPLDLLPFDAAAGKVALLPKLKEALAR
jgi:5-methyltetrahydropteroyltriglutamate--homocysteine methyltransferase